ncbi:MAG: transcriptional regulator, LuxR family [Planctomycetaceae bacterium]|nr:transcriptional regulator, LuxR family [Planctomycetaceae bacterium]
MSTSGAIISEFLPTEIVGTLLASALAIGDDNPNLADRRRAILNVLAELIDADAGFWSWGRGWPEMESVTPIALVDFGFTDEQRGDIVAWSLDHDATRNFERRIEVRVRQNFQATSLCEDVFTDSEWDANPLMRQQLVKAGFEDWIHTVRYSTGDTWSSMFLLRNLGKPRFVRQEADVVDVAHSNIAWLHSNTEEALSPESFVGLKPRQRAVMLMLLDGLSRKKIASLLGIVEDTVGDHIKAIYNHFNVSSATELAALFLRAK